MGKRISSITPYKTERWDLFAEGYYLNMASSFNIDAEADDDAFAVGGILKMVVSSNSTCLEMRFSVYIKRTAPTV